MSPSNSSRSNKEKLKAWLKDGNNLWLMGIVLAALVLKLYFFYHTQSQAMWWDEAEYMASAKHWSYGVPYDLNPQRPPLFQLLAAGLLFLGISELSIKFLLVIIPSIILLITVYQLGLNLYDKKIALLATLGTGFVWTYTFWSERFQPDFLSVLFQCLALLFFWKLFKQPTNKLAMLAGFFTAISFYFKISGLLVPLTAGIYAIFLDGWKSVKRKEYWIAIAAFLITLIPFFIWQFHVFGNPLAFAPSYIEGRGVDQRAFGWQALSYMYAFPQTLFFILFAMGAGFFISRFGLSVDLYLKDRGKRIDASLFSALVILIQLTFYIFYIQGTIEDRWVFLLVPFIFFFASEAIVWIESKIAKINKKFAILVIFLLFGYFLYTQISYTSALIDNKKDSYLPVKEASIWIKQNSNKYDSILSISYTQTTTYSERQVYSFSSWNATYMSEFIQTNKPKYLLVSIFEPHPSWVQSWINDNQKILSPVRAYYADSSQQQPILIVYEIKY